MSLTVFIPIPRRVRISDWRLLGADREESIPRPMAVYRKGFTIEDAEWRDFVTGTRLPSVTPMPDAVTERELAADRPLYLRTMRSLFTAHVRAPERKAVQTDGRPCTSRTASLLRPMPTEAHTMVAIGRETNYSEEAGVLNEPAYTTFPDPERDRTSERALTILRTAARRDGHSALACTLGLSDSALRRYLKSGRARTRTQARALQHAASIAGDSLLRAHPRRSARWRPIRGGALR
jgi:hypothetical protein